MKQPEDKYTLELPGLEEAAKPVSQDAKRSPGRPRVHVDQAARQRAYRQRLKDAGSQASIDTEQFRGTPEAASSDGDFATAVVAVRRLEGGTLESACASANERDSKGGCICSC